MMFLYFVKACKKYKFTYILSSYHGLILILRPNNTFDNIEIEQEFYDYSYFKLFSKAIKVMKAYRKGCESR